MTLQNCEKGYFCLKCKAFHISERDPFFYEHMNDSFLLDLKENLCSICKLNKTCQHNSDFQCIEVMKFFDYHYSGYLINTDPKLRYDR